MYSTKKLLYLFLSLFISVPILGENPIFIQKQFQWKEQVVSFQIADQNIERWDFAGGVVSDEHPNLAFLVERFPINGYGELRVTIRDAEYEIFTWNDEYDKSLISDQPYIQTSVEKDRRQYFGKITLLPIIKEGNRYKRLSRVALQIDLIPKVVITPRDPFGAETSVLNDGDIYKISVDRQGIYRIDYNFLKGLGINVDQIDPNQIQLFGNGGGMLPFYTEAERIDDLAENHIKIIGGGDGRFDSGDYLLFYADGPNKWNYNPSARVFEMQKNIFEDKQYYFIKISNENGARLQNQNSLDQTAFTSTSFDDYARYEIDKVNILHAWEKAEGSGQKWYGDHFKILRNYSYNDIFNFPNLLPSAPTKIKVEMMLRSGSSTHFVVDINGQKRNSNKAARVRNMNGALNNTVSYAHIARFEESFNLNTERINIDINYPSSSEESEGWLDFIQINTKRQLIMTGDQMSFRDLASINQPTTTFQLANATANLEVWDITDPLRPKLQVTKLNGNNLSFGVETSSLKEFIAFRQNQAFPAPEAIGKIENQNLHGIREADMVIVYHPDFAEQVQRLVQHRTDYSNLKVLAIKIDQLYNEFASGSADPTSIRDFAKLLYNRSDQFRYLLLFGDGSFDYKDKYEKGDNYIPVFQKDSTNPLFAFPSDDYFAILNSNNSNDPLTSDLSISVGRLPVKSLEESKIVIDKIINYETNPQTLGDWQNRMVFIADDEDTNLHIDDADEIADDLVNTFPNINLDKIFLDAFPQVKTPAGDRFPEATEALNKSIFKGTLAVTYLGHGGPQGWAQERVLSISDIIGWRNWNQLPLFVTATCSFTGYDDPGVTTAGEEVLLNPRGGSVALFTTVRAVYAGENATLTRAAMKKLFERPDNNIPTLGEVMRNAKNQFTSSSTLVNSRKFALIGDPALRLGTPQFEVKTTFVDNHDVSDGQLDTLKALQRITIKGTIVDRTGQVNTNFNGIIFPSIFDKTTVSRTLGQDMKSLVKTFKVQKNIIFKGRASVTNGHFQFSFVVPRDIDFKYGKGKISYYAADAANLADAAGSYENIVIGGTDPNALADDQGPKIDVFMNTEDFAFGGITDNKPTLLVKLEDDFGINVVGNSIGHDLEGILDENTQNVLLLNDFYESELDNPGKGTVRFPMAKLEDGLHNIRVKAWDVANNSAEGYTEFVVASSENVALEHVLNYPNPFTDFTCFQFDHNLTNLELDILIQIYTVSGRLVKSIEHTMTSDGAIRRDNCIQWDGKDDYGDQLGKGIYLYKVKVKSSSLPNAELNGESDFERLVILK